MRRASSRLAPYSCEPCLAAGRTHSGDRTPARPPLSTDDAQVHASCRHDGSRSRRDGRRRARGLSDGGQAPHAAHRRLHCAPPPPRAGVCGLGHPRRRSRGPGPAVRGAQLCHAGGSRRPIEARLARLWSRRGALPRFAGNALPARQVPVSGTRPNRRAPFRCSVISSRARGKMLTSSATSPRRKRACDLCLAANSCPPSVRSRLIGFHGRGSSIGSTRSAAPRRAMPIALSNFSGRS